MHNSLGKPEECVWFQCPTDNIVIHYYMDQLINPYHHPHPIERQCVSSLRMLVIDLVTKAVVSFAGTNRWDMEAGKRWGLNNTSTQHLPWASPKRFSGEWICNVIVVVDKYRLCFIFFSWARHWLTIIYWIFFNSQNFLSDNSKYTSLFLEHIYIYMDDCSFIPSIKDMPPKSFTL